MAFTIQLGRTTKRRNDLKRAAMLNTVTTTAILKENCSILRPTLVLKAEENGLDAPVVFSRYNYCQIAVFNRLYWITNVVAITSHIFEISCEVDVLATWYDDIIKGYGFALYAESQYNGMIPDGRLPKSNKSTLMSSATTISAFDKEGCFVLTAASSLINGKTGLVQQYVLTSSELLGIASKMFSQDIFTQLSETYNKPTEAICSCIWLPLSKSMISEGGANIMFGNADFGFGSCAKRDVIFSNDVVIKVPYFDELTGTCADYRNCEPYTQASVWLPGVGLIELPLITLIGDGGSGTEIPLTVQYNISVSTGEINYQIVRQSNTVGEYRTILTAHGNIGVTLPTSSANNGSMSALMSAVAVAGAATTVALAPNALPYMAGTMINAGASTVSNLFQESYAASGNVGGFQDFETAYSKIITITKYYETSDSPANIKDIMGRPLFKKVLISDLNGFASFDSVYIETGKNFNFSAMSEELDMIQRLMNGGVFVG